jgi:hypothetical protein
MVRAHLHDFYTGPLVQNKTHVNGVPRRSTSGTPQPIRTLKTISI